jgi:hypothetical protein
MNVFIFNNQTDAKAAYRAEVPPNIKNEHVLLDALSVALRFPAYFGRNWDALDECIQDLSWLPPGDVVLIHKDLPLAGRRDALAIYLSILRDAIGNWDTRGSNLIYASPEEYDATGERSLLVRRKFLVTFPPDAETVVRSILANVENSSDSSGSGRP